MQREPGGEAGFARDDDDLSDDGLRPLRQARPFARTRLAARFACAAALIAGLSLLAREKPAAHAAGPARAAAPSGAAEAVRTAAAGPLLALAGVEGRAQALPPRWSPATGVREDTLLSGGFDGIEAPFLRITVSEASPGAEPAGREHPSLFVVLARRAAETRGLSVVRTGLRGVLDTKFGRFETVEAVLGGAGSRQCTGFASLDARGLRIDGWLCGLLGQAPEPRALACAVDALALAAAAPPPVEAAFETAERARRPDCLPGPEAGRGGDTTGSIGSRGRPDGVGPGPVRTPRKGEVKPRRIT